jgi:uncharacterized protein (DUF433 family)
MTTVADWIEKTPGICGGEARIHGTRITVWGLVEYWQLGLSDADILERLPGLSPAALEAARDYYRNHPSEIDRVLWENRAAGTERQGQNVPVWLIVQGRQLGLADSTIRAAFDSPLTPAELDKAFSFAESNSAEVAADIRRHTGGA